MEQNENSTTKPNNGPNSTKYVYNIFNHCNKWFTSSSGIGQTHL